MHRKLWARLLSCYVALTMVFAGVPVQAFSEDLEHPDQDSVEYADGALYYSNSQWSYNCLRNDGYGVEGYPTWDDFNAQTRQAILESMAWQEFILLYGGYNPMRGQWVWTRPSDAIASQMRDYLQDIVDSTAEIKPYQPGGIGGGSSSGDGDEPGDGPQAVPPVVDNLMSFTVKPQQVSSSYTETSSYNSTFKFTVSNGTSTTTQTYSFDPNNTSGYALPPSINLSVGSTVYNYINECVASGNDAVVLVGNRSGTGNVAEQYWAINVYPLPSGSYSIGQPTSHSDWGVYYTGPNTSGKAWYFPNSIRVVDNALTFNYNLNANDINLSQNSYAKFNHGGVWYVVFSGNPGGGTGGTVSPVPDPSTIEKPESPVTPSNPQTPERDSPTIVIGGTTQTVPDPSPAPDLSTIEDLLRRILANTNTIIEQMNSFASQLGQELAEFYDAVYDWFGVIDTRLRDQIALLDSEIEWLEGIFDWTKSIDTDIQYLQSVCSNGFDNVVGVLRRILERMTLAGDSGGSKPGIVDPADPSPVMDWLRQLWTSFLADLQMVLPDQVGAVVDFLDQLRQKFPFSIPWDIAAMLALLNHAPVTPVVDIPWGYAGGIQYVHVDCHAWDDAVEIVRPMFLLLFALGLALLTRELLAGLEAVL